MIIKKVVPGSTSRLLIVDHKETYGRHILDKIVRHETIATCVDFGCGTGQDLRIIKAHHPNAKLVGLDTFFRDRTTPNEDTITRIVTNIENTKLPFESNSIDFIIANQIVEHTKEIFFINHEIFRCLKVNGALFLGVPNLLSLHNRILMLFGYHPTCSKMTSAHVRVFSKKDVTAFYQNIGSSFCKVEQFHGSQFYPFPKPIARFLSSLFPHLAYSNFYLIRKTGLYTDEFVTWPNRAQLETNYYTGKHTFESYEHPPHQ
jgi:SAM-dependent methyltransferase